MSSILVLLCVSWCALAAAWSADPAPAPYALEDAEIHFEHFIQKFDRNYVDEYEKQARFQIFKERLEKINKLNENSKHAVFGITQFADLSHEEYKRKFTCLRRSPGSYIGESACSFIYDKDINYNDAPESFDWREHGAVTPIKDQEQCGSCFAFSAIGSVEGQHAIKNKELIRLSEQQIVDCDKKDGGCQGGYMNVAMRSLIDQGGSVAEADYPYQGVENECQFDASKVKVKLTDCRSYNLTSQEKLKQLLYHTGPISIGINADDPFNLYERGIVSSQYQGLNIDHGVLLVGYGSENGVPFWIVKNSWGVAWGEQGYFRMERGEDVTSRGMLNQFMASAVVA